MRVIFAADSNDTTGGFNSVGSKHRMSAIEMKETFILPRQVMCDDHSVTTRRRVACSVPQQSVSDDIQYISLSSKCDHCKWDFGIQEDRSMPCVFSHSSKPPLYLATRRRISSMILKAVSGLHVLRAIFSYMILKLKFPLYDADAWRLYRMA